MSVYIKRLIHILGLAAFFMMRQKTRTLEVTKQLTISYTATTVTIGGIVVSNQSKGLRLLVADLITYTVNRKYHTAIYDLEDKVMITVCYTPAGVVLEFTAHEFFVPINGSEVDF